MEAPTGKYPIKYIFEPLDDAADAAVEFVVELDLPRLDLMGKQAAKGGPPPAPWTRLEHHQCQDCPLKPKESPLCPVAVNLADLVETFAAAASYGRVRVRVETEERVFLKDTSLQEGLFSVFGLIMATSGCPVMDFLRPMARYHLPFATTEETLARSTSFYLLRQYFKKSAGGRPDWDLQDLKRRYAGVEKVNNGILDRVREVIQKGDADPNALVILQVFAQTAGMEIDTQLGALKGFFQVDSK
ncbi:MAG TPA: hypothetical protein VL588_11550 [Bdellovibrionota bacterium]|nr:hypothetical protein [Bdellovibrionota bacterium]